MWLLLSSLPSPLGPYSLDFYCPARRLAVEVDGNYHDEPNQIDYDAERTRYLDARGITVLRFANEAVLEQNWRRNLDDVPGVSPTARLRPVWRFGAAPEPSGFASWKNAFSSPLIGCGVAGRGDYLQEETRNGRETSQGFFHLSPFGLHPPSPLNPLSRPSPALPGSLSGPHP